MSLRRCSVLRRFAGFSALEPGLFRGFFVFIDQQRHILPDLDAVQG
jgi:hypothetical protein